VEACLQKYRKVPPTNSTKFVQTQLVPIDSTDEIDTFDDNLPL